MASAVGGPPMSNAASSAPGQGLGAVAPGAANAPPSLTMSQVTDTRAPFTHDPVNTYPVTHDPIDILYRHTLSTHTPSTHTLSTHDPITHPTNTQPINTLTNMNPIHTPKLITLSNTPINNTPHQYPIFNRHWRPTNTCHITPTHPVSIPNPNPPTSHSITPSNIPHQQALEAYQHVSHNTLYQHTPSQHTPYQHTH